MRRGLMKLVAPITLLGVLAFVLAGQSAGQGSRVVDRTVVCAAQLNGGIYEVEIRAQSGAVRKGSRWDKPALAMVTTGSTGSAAQALYNAVAWVVAGTPSGEASLVQTMVGITYPVRTWGTLAMANRCRASRVRPALNAAGLSGGSVDPFGTLFDCPTPRRFLIRLRAVLGASSPLRSRRGYLGTTTSVSEGRITISTPAGKRLAYAEVASSGRARLFTAPSCVPD
jgi:hypothetical protein